MAVEDFDSKYSLPVKVTLSFDMTMKTDFVMPEDASCSLLKHINLPRQDNTFCVGKFESEEFYCSDYRPSIIDHGALHKLQFVSIDNIDACLHNSMHTLQQSDPTSLQSLLDFAPASAKFNGGFTGNSQSEDKIHSEAKSVTHLLAVKTDADVKKTSDLILSGSDNVNDNFKLKLHPRKGLQLNSVEEDQMPVSLEKLDKFEQLEEQCLFQATKPRNALDESAKMSQLDHCLQWIISLVPHLVWIFNQGDGQSQNHISDSCKQKLESVNFRTKIYDSVFQVNHQKTENENLCYTGSSTLLEPEQSKLFNDRLCATSSIHTSAIAASLSFHNCHLFINDDKSTCDGNESSTMSEVSADGVAMGISFNLDDLNLSTDVVSFSGAYKFDLCRMLPETIITSDGACTEANDNEVLVSGILQQPCFDQLNSSVVTYWLSDCHQAQKSLNRFLPLKPVLGETFSQGPNFEIYSLSFDQPSGVQSSICTAVSFDPMHAEFLDSRVTLSDDFLPHSPTVQTISQISDYILKSKKFSDIGSIVNLLRLDNNNNAFQVNQFAAAFYLLPHLLDAFLSNSLGLMYFSEPAAESSKGELFRVFTNNEKLNCNCAVGLTLKSSQVILLPIKKSDNIFWGKVSAGVCTALMKSCTQRYSAERTVIWENNWSIPLPFLNSKTAVVKAELSRSRCIFLSDYTVRLVKQNYIIGLDSIVLNTMHNDSMVEVFNSNLVSGSTVELLPFTSGCERGMSAAKSSCAKISCTQVALANGADASNCTLDAGFEARVRFTEVGDFGDVSAHRALVFSLVVDNAMVKHDIATEQSRLKYCVQIISDINNGNFETSYMSSTGNYFNCNDGHNIKLSSVNERGAKLNEAMSESADGCLLAECDWDADNSGSGEALVTEEDVECPLPSTVSIVEALAIPGGTVADGGQMLYCMESSDWEWVAGGFPGRFVIGADGSCEMEDIELKFVVDSSKTHSVELSNANIQCTSNNEPDLLETFYSQGVKGYVGYASVGDLVTGNHQNEVSSLFISHDSEHLQQVKDDSDEVEKTFEHLFSINALSNRLASAALNNLCTNCSSDAYTEAKPVSDEGSCSLNEGVLGKNNDCTGIVVNLNTLPLETFNVLEYNLADVKSDSVEVSGLGSLNVDNFDRTIVHSRPVCCGNECIRIWDMRNLIHTNENSECVLQSTKSTQCPAVIITSAGVLTSYNSSVDSVNSLQVKHNNFCDESDFDLTAIILEAEYNLLNSFGISTGSSYNCNCSADDDSVNANLNSQHFKSETADNLTTVHFPASDLNSGNHSADGGFVGKINSVEDRWIFTSVLSPEDADNLLKVILDAEHAVMQMIGTNDEAFGVN